MYLHIWFTIWDNLLLSFHYLISNSECKCIYIIYLSLSNYKFLQSLPRNGEVLFYDGAELSFNEEVSTDCEGEYPLELK